MIGKNKEKIACQGKMGAFSHLVAQEIFPKAEFLFFSTFEQALMAVTEGKAVSAVLPIENSSAGRVADMHRLLAKTRLKITGEYFYKIQHHLLGIKNSNLSDITKVYSHEQALYQCAENIKALGVAQEAVGNTAIAAERVSMENNVNVAAIASEFAAKVYGLKVLKKNVQDSPVNMTRFWIFSTEQSQKVPIDNAITSFIFWVKNKPAVLYKCLGGFATNSIDLLRLESYVSPENFLSSAGFIVDVASHQDSVAFKRALEELEFFAESFQILGTYKPAKYRHELKN